MIVSLSFLSAPCGDPCNSLLLMYVLFTNASALLQLTQRLVRCAACCSNSALWLLHISVASPTSPGLTTLCFDTCIACTFGAVCDCCLLAKQGSRRKQHWVMSISVLLSNCDLVLSRCQYEVWWSAVKADGFSSAAQLLLGGAGKALGELHANFSCQVLQ